MRCRPVDQKLRDGTYSQTVNTIAVDERVDGIDRRLGQFVRVTQRHQFGTFALQLGKILRRCLDGRNARVQDDFVGVGQTFQVNVRQPVMFCQV